MINDTPLEKTINAANNLIEFQKIVKLSGKYDYVYHNDKKYTNKCYRVFASKSDGDGIIYKVKQRTKKVDVGIERLIVPDTPKFDKFANTPEKCFLNNGDIREVNVPQVLDRQWYIDLAYERLRQFGGK